MWVYDHPDADEWSWRRFLAIGGAYLWMEHRAHLLGALVFLPLLLCPLMHLFMHHGHGEHSEPKGPRQ